MRLTGPDGFEFDLTVVRYQFPRIKPAPGDSNWLLVKIQVKHPRGAWEATGPFLLTTEVAQLATWFDAVAVEAPMINRETWIESGRPQVAGFPNLRLFDSAEFLEPNLRFALWNAPARMLSFECISSFERGPHGLHHSLWERKTCTSISASPSRISSPRLNLSEPS